MLTRSDFRVPRLATADLAGDVVTETVPRGKHLLTRTANGLTVHTHLKMDGSWRIRPAAERPRDSHRIRLLLANDDWQAIGYQLGVVELIRTSEESRVTGHLGPDLLGPDWDRAEAVRRLSAQPDRPIGEALLDQRNLAGHRQRVLGRNAVPAGQSTRGALSATSTDLDALVELGQRLLEANKARSARSPPAVAGAARELGVRARGQAVPTVRDPDQQRLSRVISRAGTGQILVPALPEVTAGRASAVQQPRQIRAG